MYMLSTTYNRTYWLMLSQQQLRAFWTAITSSLGDSFFFSTTVESILNSNYKFIGWFLLLWLHNSPLRSALSFIHTSKQLMLPPISDARTAPISMELTTISCWVQSKWNSALSWRIAPDTTPKKNVITITITNLNSSAYQFNTRERPL